MRRATRNGVIAAAAVVAASGAVSVALPVSAAFAADGAGAEGAAAGSPGLISGNDIQLPVDVPV
ncbi:chaplin family protein, partial [Streptomyces sp. NPDC004561]